MYVANTRSSQYIHAISLDAACNMVERSIFADLKGFEIRKTHIGNGGFQSFLLLMDQTHPI